MDLHFYLIFTVRSYNHFVFAVFHIAVYPVCEEEEGMVQCSKTNVRFSLWFNRRSILFQVVKNKLSYSKL